ncbi:hypothetical protein OSTOST_13406 [Ostertagia ostertagi]
MNDTGASNNSSPVLQRPSTNGHHNTAVSSYNIPEQQLPVNLDRTQLQHERDAAVAAYEQVSAQLEQLRMHYAQLHAAYSSMSNSAVHSDADKQIQQLQSLSANMKSLRGDESKKLQNRLVECEHLLSARSVELDGLRRSEANAQAQLLAVQHERSEAQARLKVIAREKEVLDSELKQVRKELHMKEIYLKQLGPHGIMNNMSDENTIKALHAHNNETCMFSPGMMDGVASEQLYQQQPYVISVTEDSVTNSSPALSASNNPLKNVMNDTGASNNSSPVLQRPSTNGHHNTAVSSYNIPEQQLPVNLDRTQLQHERDAAVALMNKVPRNRTNEPLWTECEHLLSARSVELDGLRRSEANAQAQLLAVQHERSEAQARLKVIAREKEVLDSELKQVRKELHMKEIYLKQLGPHGIMNNMSDENTIKALHDRIDALQAQVGLLTNERDQMHHNSQELSRHYEICRLEFVNTRDKIANELAEAASERDAALLRVKELENDVSVLQKEQSKNKSVALPMNMGLQESAIAFTEEDLMYKVNEAKRRADAEWQQKFDEEGRVVDSMLRNKDQLIFEREQTISELQMRLRLLEERSAETRASGSDLLSLSEQLQNEKATVSRAVAQNRELKEQLLETEDRLVALTEEKLHSELARQTAEHQVKELMKRIDTEVSARASQTDSGSVQLQSAPLLSKAGALEAVLHPATSLEPSRSTEDWDETERDRSESVADVSRWVVNAEQMLEPAGMLSTNY